MNDFEKGAVFAIKVLKELVETRLHKISHLNTESETTEADLGLVFNGVNNLLVGLRQEFDNEVAVQMRKLFPFGKEADSIFPLKVKILGVQSNKNRYEVIDSIDQFKPGMVFTILETNAKESK
jgi:hypothetical protein